MITYVSQFLSVSIICAALTARWPKRESLSRSTSERKISSSTVDMKCYLILNSLSTTFMCPTTKIWHWACCCHIVILLSLLSSLQSKDLSKNVLVKKLQCKMYPINMYNSKINDWYLCKMLFKFQEMLETYIKNTSHLMKNSVSVTTTYLL